MYIAAAAHSASDAGIVRTQAVLAKILAENETAILPLPGVTGCGVGFSRRAGPSRVVIQVFVEAATEVARIQSEVERMLGGEHAVEAVAMPVLEGD